jgi:hypothetical protein
MIGANTGVRNGWKQRHISRRCCHASEDRCCRPTEELSSAHQSRELLTCEGNEVIHGSHPQAALEPAT